MNAKNKNQEPNLQQNMKQSKSMEKKGRIPMSVCCDSYSGNFLIKQQEFLVLCSFLLLSFEGQHKKNTSKWL